MKETEEIMGMIKEEGAAYFARERGNKVEVGLYLEHIIEERGMKKKDIVRKLNLEESYARKLFGGQRIPVFLSLSGMPWRDLLQSKMQL